MVVLVAAAHIDPTAIVVTNRPSPSDLPPPLPKTNRDRLVYVGDVRASRGLFAMLDLMDLLSDLSLDIVGPMGSIDGLDARLATTGLADRVSFHGRLSYEESWELARGALAGLCLLEHTPAFAPAQPTKIWEYWTIGLPVAASDLPGQRALIEMCGAGAVGDIEELATTIRTWRDDPAAALELGLLGRRHVVDADDGSEDRLLCAIEEALQR
jgi:glycosyltransferase involved in cell wall biosynthesis